MQNKIVTPYFSLPFGQKSPKLDLRQLSSLGFDGIEAFLIGNLLTIGAIERLREEAHCANLSIRFHQGWSWKNGQRIPINYILRALGALTPSNQTLTEQFQNIGDDPVVVYANHLLEQEFLPKNYIFQTVSVFDDNDKYQFIFPGHREFLGHIKRHNARLVFDTQHYLEWIFNKPFVSQLPNKSKFVTDTVIAGWKLYAPYVDEIHLCDFDPSLGAQNGRNVFPGNGILDMKAFAEAVKDSGWTGVVSPEVKPEHIKTYKDLELLVKQVRSLF